ncbi:MAG: C_GCAxxG_C_C family protein [Bacteroidales bacterium]|nr:C_GCAxxG_C_C family protein [Bacteroidales bacterium]MBR4478362.1 C_GCAxxG_C_C family protein [Bacteroidales bacterium]
MTLPESFDPAERGERAKGLFLQGYNCCQAVLLAFADILGAEGLADEDLLKTIGSGFGGGFARMREVCGSFSGCTVMAGFIRPAVTPGLEERKANYALVQEMAAAFRERNGGSIVCGELLGLRGHKPEGPTPSERTEEFYRKRPCPEIIRNAAVIVAEKMKEAAL